MGGRFVFFWLIASCTSISYDDEVLAAHPTLYAPLNNFSNVSMDKNGLEIVFSNTTNWDGSTLLPNGDSCVAFDNCMGGSQSLFHACIHPRQEVNLSFSSVGGFSLEAWVKPFSLSFVKTQKSSGCDSCQRQAISQCDFVHFLGKGSEKQKTNEYAGRFYSNVSSLHISGCNKTSSCSRKSYLSGYIFNSSAGLGNGNRYGDLCQDNSNVTVGDWIHYVMVVTPAKDVLLFINGTQQKHFANLFNIVPTPSDAPLCVATSDLSSFFCGAIGKVAFYHYNLNESVIQQHFQSMLGGSAIVDVRLIIVFGVWGGMCMWAILFEVYARCFIVKRRIKTK